MKVGGDMWGGATAFLVRRAFGGGGAQRSRDWKGEEEKAGWARPLQLEGREHAKA